MKDSGTTAQKVNVCIIVENLAVPADRRVWQEARALAEAGYGVFIICPKGRGYNKFRERLDGIEIYRHPGFESSGFLGHIVEYVWSILAEFALALLVYARCRFQVLQACNPPDNLFLIALFFKLFGVRFIFDHHDLGPELCLVRFPNNRLLYRLMILLERCTFRTADVTIATNESFRQIAHSRGHVQGTRTFVVQTCPDLRRLRSCPDPRLKEGKKNLVLYVGIMELQDGLDLLLDSVSHIVGACGRTDTLFVLIGWGTEVARLKARVAELRLGPYVRFVGAKYEDDLWAYLSTADVAVAPDPFNVLNDKLTMIKILEYMAFGLPVVLYDLAEGRRSAGEAAFYAKKNDPIDFAEQIEHLLQSELLRARLGAIGKERIQSGMRWDREAMKLLQAYETALSQTSELHAQDWAKPQLGANKNK